MVHKSKYNQPRHKKTAKSETLQKIKGWKKVDWTYLWNGQETPVSRKNQTGKTITIMTITIAEVPLSRLINLAHINARSVCNKKDQIQEQIVTHNLNLCVITETWIKQDDSTMAKEILPPGYSVSSSPCQGNRAGGGTALIYKDIFNVTQTATPSLTTMECSSYGLRFGSNCIKLYIIYRQPEGSVLSFCEEFATLLENDIMDTRNPIIVGDLNIHMEDTSNADTRLFLDVLESLNL